MGGVSTLSDQGFQPQQTAPQAPAAPHPLADLGFKPMQQQPQQSAQSPHPLADLGFRPIAAPKPSAPAQPSPYVDTSKVAGAGPAGVPQLPAHPAVDMQPSVVSQAADTLKEAATHPIETLTGADLPSQIAEKQALLEQSAAGGDKLAKSALDVQKAEQTPLVQMSQTKTFQHLLDPKSKNVFSRVLTGGTKALEALSSPDNVELLGALPLAPEDASQLLSGVFGTQMTQGAAADGYQAIRAAHRGDYGEAAERGATALLNAAMAAASAKHAARGEDVQTSKPADQPAEPTTAEEKPILHATDNVEDLRASAERQAPALGDAAKAATEGVPGAKVEAVRDAKDADRIEDKAERQGVQPSQIADIAAAKVTVPDQAAADKVLENLHEQMPVESVNGSLDEPGKNGVRQVQAVVDTKAGEGEPIKKAEVLIQTPEMNEATARTHDDYRKSQELRAAGKDAEAEALEKKITAEHEAAAQKSEQKQGENKPKYDYGNTQTNIPDESDAGKALAAVRTKIDPQDLNPTDYGGSSKGLETEPHVTVRYGVKGDDTAGIEKYLRSQAPFEAKLGKLSVFPPNDHTEGAAVLKADVDAPELHRINDELGKHGDFKESDFPEYKPHATVAYVKPEAAAKYDGMNDTDGKTFTVSSIAINDRDGNSKEIPLEGRKEVAPTGLRAPKPPSAMVRDAAGKEHAVPEWAASKLQAPRPPAKPADFGTGPQNTRVEVRDADGAWHRGTLNYYTDIKNGPPGWRGRVRMDSGETLRSVPREALRPAREEVKGVTSGVGEQTKPTHGAVAYDLDKTLAHYDGYKGPTEIGKPIESEVASLKRDLADGKDVWIFSARAADSEAVPAIKAWTKEHVGRELPVTNVKYPEFARFVDDRAEKPGYMEGKGGNRPEATGVRESIDGSAAESAGDRSRTAADTTREPQTDRNAERPAPTETVRREPPPPEPDHTSVSAREIEPNAGAPESKAPENLELAREQREYEERLAKRRSGLKEANDRSLWQNAAKHQSRSVDLGDGNRAVVLDPDGEGVWHRLLKYLPKTEHGQNPAGAGHGWRGIALTREQVNAALNFFKVGMTQAKFGGHLSETAAGYERLAQALRDSRDANGGAVILRGDYGAHTVREEQLHQWQREHQIDRSYAINAFAEEPEMHDVVEKLREKGYGRYDPRELGIELAAKAMAGDADLHITDDERENLVRSYLTTALEERGTDIFNNLPAVDPRVRAVVDEVRRGYDYSEEFDQRPAEGRGEAARSGYGPGSEGPGEEFRSGAGDSGGRRPGGEGVQRGDEGEATAQGELKAPRPPERRTAQEKTQNPPSPEGSLFQRAKAPKPPDRTQHAEVTHPLFQRALEDEEARRENPWFLKSAKVVDAKMKGPMPGDALVRMLENNGVKADELKWSGLEDLKGRAKVTPDEVHEHLVENAIKVNEVVKGEPSRLEKLRAKPNRTEAEDTEYERLATEQRLRGAVHGDANVPKYRDYQLPGGKNYREMLLTMPGGEKPSDNFKSGHWDEPNILAHVRMNDRTAPDGKKLLHLEEIQSDWHQRGRDVGYRQEEPATVEDAQKFFGIKDADWARMDDQQKNNYLEEMKSDADYIRKGKREQVPDAPFKKDWQEMAFRRMVKYAADNGYDGVSWTPGEKQAERYDLSKQIDELHHLHYEAGEEEPESYSLVGFKNGRGVFDQYLPQEKLESAVGKDVAAKVRAGEGSIVPNEGARPERLYRKLSGIDLKLGGEGMKGFYDKIIPDYARKFGKQWGAKVSEVNLGEAGYHAERAANVHGEPAWHVVDSKGNPLESDVMWKDKEMADHRAGELNKKGIGNVPYLEITPEMRKDVVEHGVPLFQKSDKEDYVPDWVHEEMKRGYWERPERPTQKDLPFGGEPVWRRAVGAFRQYRDNPEDAGDAQRQLMRDTRGQMDRQVLQLKHQFEDVRKDFVGMKREEVTHFIDAIEDGRIGDLDSKYGDIAKGLHAMLRQDREELRTLDPELLKNYYENYFPHLWDQSGKAARMMRAQSGTKPLFGSGSFLQHRTLYPPTFKEGIKLGLEPKTWNPVDMALMKHTEIQRYMFGLRTVERMKAQGLTKMYTSAKEAPPNWMQLDDRFARVAHRNDNGELVLDGHYYAPAPAASVFNRFVSRGLRGRHGAIDAAFGLNNLLNSVQLGLSAYHATASAINLGIGDLALGFQELAQGRPIDAAKHIGRGLVPGASAIRAGLVGNRMMGEYLEPGSAAKYEAEANWLARAGGRPEQSLNLQPERWKQLGEDIKQGNWVKAGKGAIPAALDMAGGWLMHGIIPRIKLGTFQDMAANILKAAPERNWDDNEVRRRMQQAWDNVDNRYGQMIYDNQFWHRTALDSAQLGMRSVGWNLGSLREYGGAIPDTLRAFARAADRRRPDLTAKMAFTLATPIYQAFAAAALTYLMTGHGPDKEKFGWRAYFYPEMASGQLMKIPGYFNDWVSMGHDPVTTVEHKASPLLSTMASMYQNENYYGNAIRNEDDPIVRQGLDELTYLGKQFVPFSIESFQQQRRDAGGGELSDVTKKQSGGMGLLGYAGFQPAPRAIQNSAAMNLAEHYRDETPEAPRTREQARHSATYHNLVTALREGNLNDEKLDKAFEEGKVTQREYAEAQRDAFDPPIVRVTRRLSLEQALQVWKKATPEEQEQLQEVIARKATNAYQNEPDAVSALEPQIDAVLAQR